MAERRTKTIKTDYLARVEGEGGMRVRIEDGVVTDVELNIFEPPRFFEAFLRGRAFTEAPDITARICGICPVAYQMSAVHGDGAGLRRRGRRAARARCAGCSTAASGSRATRCTSYMLHAPDFLGYDERDRARPGSTRSSWRRRSS